MAFIHHTKEEQKRFWELMNRFENEEGESAFRKVSGR